MELDEQKIVTLKHIKKKSSFSGVNERWKNDQNGSKIFEQSWSLKSMEIDVEICWFFCGDFFEFLD